jgi:hypothetical protein
LKSKEVTNKLILKAEELKNLQKLVQAGQVLNWTQQQAFQKELSSEEVTGQSEVARLRLLHQA